MLEIGQSHALKTSDGLCTDIIYEQKLLSTTVRVTSNAYFDCNLPSNRCSYFQKVYSEFSLILYIAGEKKKSYQCVVSEVSLSNKILPTDFVTD